MGEGGKWTGAEDQARNRKGETHFTVFTCTYGTQSLVFLSNGCVRLPSSLDASLEGKGGQKKGRLPFLSKELP